MSLFEIEIDDDMIRPGYRPKRFISTFEFQNSDKDILVTAAGYLEVEPVEPPIVWREPTIEDWGKVVEVSENGQHYGKAVLFGVAPDEILRFWALDAIGVLKQYEYARIKQ